MRAIVIHAPKDLRLDEMETLDPGPGEVRVRMAAGGICGSDLHYYNHGGFGVVRIREPMALGHEIAGVVEAVGPGVTRVATGQRVAVNPSRPCNACKFCLAGMPNQCLDMRFMGSAMRFPHVQGGFREYVCVGEAQAVPVADGASLGEAAMAEPLAVCLHGARQAGPLLGKKVLVTGSGPIGALATLVAATAGAADVVTVDVADPPLKLAKAVGARRTINTRSDAAALSEYSADKGYFDVLFEASGAEPALRGALDVVRPGGTVVQLGLGGDMSLPMNTIVAKEIALKGAFRFGEEFQLAVDMIGRGLVDVKPLITATLPIERAVEAFELANDKSRSMKVQIAF